MFAKFIPLDYSVNIVLCEISDGTFSSMPSLPSIKVRLYRYRIILVFVFALVYLGIHEECAVQI